MGNQNQTTTASSSSSSSATSLTSPPSPSSVPISTHPAAANHAQRRSALIESVKMGRLAEVEPLLAARADVNLRDQYGRTALHYAFGAVVRLLLDAQADMFAPDLERLTVLHQCANRAGDHESDVVKAAILLDAGAFRALSLRSDRSSGTPRGLALSEPPNPRLAAFLEQAERDGPPLCRLWRELRLLVQTNAFAGSPVSVLACAPLSALVQRLLSVLRRCGVAVNCPRFDHRDLFANEEANAKLSPHIASVVLQASHTVVVVDGRLHDLRRFAQQRCEAVAKARPQLTIVLDGVDYDTTVEGFEDVLKSPGPPSASSTTVLLQHALLRCAPKAVQSLEKVKRWMSDHDAFAYSREAAARGTVPSTRVKLSLIGHAAAGKTSTARLLFTQQPVMLSKHEPTESVTVGIVRLGGCEFVVQDFPGQQEFHGTNLSFMASEQALFLAVYDLTLPEAVLHAQLSGWLSSLTFLSAEATLGFKPQPPTLILIGTHADLVGKDVSLNASNVMYWRKCFPSISIVASLRIACTNSDDVRELCRVVSEAGEIVCKAADPIPRSVLGLSQEIAALRSKAKWVTLEYFHGELSRWLRIEAAVAPAMSQPVVASASVSSPQPSRSKVAAVSAVANSPLLSDAARAAQVSAAALVTADDAEREAKSPAELTDEDSERLTALEAILEMQGDALRLAVGDLSLIVIDPQWFAKVLTAVVQPCNSPFHGLQTTNGVTDRKSIEMALNASEALNVSSLECPGQPNMSVMDCLFSLLVTGKTCFELPDHSYLIPSRVTAAHLDYLRLRSPLVAVRLRVAGEKLVLPPGLFAQLMCTLRAPLNFADDPGMFATHEFLVVNKDHSVRTVVAIAEANTSIDVLSCGVDLEQTEAEVTKVVLQIQSLKDSSRWSGLRWSASRLCAACAVSWSVSAEQGYVRGEKLCPKRAFELSEAKLELPAQVPCLRGWKLAETVVVAVSAPVPQESAARSEVAAEFKSVLEVCKALDDARVWTAAVEQFVGRLHTRYPEDLTINELADPDRALILAVKKARLKKWLLASAAAGVPFDAIAHCARDIVSWSTTKL